MSKSVRKKTIEEKEIEKEEGGKLLEDDEEPPFIPIIGGKKAINADDRLGKKRDSDEGIELKVPRKAN